MKQPNQHSFRSVQFLMVSALLLTLMITGCAPKSPVTPSAMGATQVAEENASADFAGKKIVYVNSYHEGYPWSDGIETGLHTVLDGTGVELKIIRLDTKQNPDVEFGNAAGAKAWSEIQAYKPDIVIASDDNAQKYLVVPQGNRIWRINGKLWMMLFPFVLYRKPEEAVTTPEFPN